MNINLEIANRALEAVGQERLNDEDIEKNSARWRLIKDNYLSVILTTLAKTTWTSRLKRAKLTLDEDGENLTDYGYKYFLPIDCEKPEGLNDKGEYIVEGRFLYTNSADAVLQYVSNEKRNPINEELSDEEQDAILSEDYPEYGEMEFDPSLKEYIELQLAAKISLKITGDINTFNLLYQQALIIENDARKATLEHAHSKEQGQAWWGDMIGLSVEGE